MDQASGLKDVLVYLVAAGVLIPLFHRARVSAVVGFILIGAVIGPHGLGQLAGQFPLVSYVTIADVHRVGQFGELGVVVLLFLLGLEFSAGKLWSLRREVFGLGLLQVLFCGAVLAMGTYLSGLAPATSIVVGFALAMSSTALVMQLLLAERRALAPLGRTALAVLLFQDLTVVPVLLAAELLGQAGGGLVVLILTAIGKAAAAIGIILLAGRFLIAPLVAAAAGTGARDLLMAVTLVVVAGTAGLTHAAGLSAALGAFLAGMLLSGTAYQHQISVDLEPFKGLLIGVFFVSVGMSLDMAAVVPHLLVILLAAAAIILVKLVLTFAAARLFRTDRPLAGELAALLAQTGEFAFVAIGLLRVSGALNVTQAGILVAVVTLTLIVTPLLARMGGLLRTRLEHQQQDGQSMEFDPPPEGHVVIGGFGRVGRIVAEALEDEGVPFIALDADAGRVRAERAAGRQVFFGDASRQEILGRVIGARASAFVVTLDAAPAAEGMVRAARALQPDAIILARVKDAAHAQRLARLGASNVIPETVEASLHLAGMLLQTLGLPEEAVARRIDQARERERVRLTSVSSE
ncbi:cation:proton antiporter [Xanthobacter sp. DSM 24535]|uniref:cation:proton antiporter domain-containing protein n=1 Tax=Roseixanthobacter psychrophilus TaxID=3119917 RepID=UPI0037269DA4